MAKAWAKREAQVSARIESTVGMVGDLHGIMGQAIPEIDALKEPPMLEGKAAQSTRSLAPFLWHQGYRGLCSGRLYNAGWCQV
jgi:hypothetical protein